MQQAVVKSGDSVLANILLTMNLAGGIPKRSRKYLESGLEFGKRISGIPECYRSIRSECEVWETMSRGLKSYHLPSNQKISPGDLPCLGTVRSPESQSPS